DDLELAVSKRLQQGELRHQPSELSLVGLNRQELGSLRETLERLETEQIATLDVYFEIVRNAVRSQDLFKTLPLYGDAPADRTEALVSRGPLGNASAPVGLLIREKRERATLLRDGEIEQRKAAFRDLSREPIRERLTERRHRLYRNDRKAQAQIERRVLTSVSTDVVDQAAFSNSG